MSLHVTPKRCSRRWSVPRCSSGRAACPGSTPPRSAGRRLVSRLLWDLWCISIFLYSLPESRWIFFVLGGNDHGHMEPETQALERHPFASDEVLAPCQQCSELRAVDGDRCFSRQEFSPSGAFSTPAATCTKQTKKRTFHNRRNSLQAALREFLDRIRDRLGLHVGVQHSLQLLFVALRVHFVLRLIRVDEDLAADLALRLAVERERLRGGGRGKGVGGELRWSGRGKGGFGGTLHMGTLSVLGISDFEAR